MNEHANRCAAVGVTFVFTQGIFPAMGNQMLVDFGSFRCSFPFVAKPEGDLAAFAAIGESARKCLAVVFKQPCSFQPISGICFGVTWQKPVNYFFHVACRRFALRQMPSWNYLKMSHIGKQCKTIESHANATPKDC
ncbi:MAG: hypothetical protein KDN22_05835 [Verrucomicrobiae bacterium]|nr:hypothetical protein [Verrucomicrobiae bacterium]